MNTSCPPAMAAPIPVGGALRSRCRRGLLALVSLLLLAVLASLCLGAKDIPLGTVIDALRGQASGEDQVIVAELRLARTALGVIVGVAIGTAGALIQGLTRNPLADPGVLGVNAGAALAVVTAISVFGITSVMAYVWCALLGAALAAGVVFTLGATGRGSAADPMRLVLAGVALAAVLAGLSRALMLLNPHAFDGFRHWDAGSLAGREIDVVKVVGPLIVVGLIGAALAATSLNALALGDDLAISLGAKVIHVRVVTLGSVTILCGAATAAIGPVAFLGLMAAHIARRITGADHRWIVAYAGLVGPVVMLLADVLGRVVLRPDEMPVGVVAAFVGAPVLVMLARRKELRSL